MSGLSLSDKMLLADKCMQISEDVKDEKGFVSAKNLSQYFDAKLVFRPLLVEAMLATDNGASINMNDGTPASKWAVLLDSEPYPALSSLDFEKESPDHPLPNRLRFTVAHELAHTLAFRAKEFGIELSLDRSKSKNNKSEFVDAIENITDKISPLLLIPKSYIESIFSKDKEDVSINNFLRVKREMSVSYPVLVNRIKMLTDNSVDELLTRPSLSDLAIGVGVWSDQRRASIKRWPVFVNFTKNIIPALLSELVKGKIRNFSSYIDDPSFLLNGGEKTESTAIVPAGTINNPYSEKMNIRIEVEPVQRRAGAEFLFLVQNNGSDAGAM